MPDDLTLKCPNCNAARSADAKYCSNCGHQITAEPVADAQIVEYMVVKDGGRVLPCLLAKPKRCPGCKAKAETVPTISACMKIKYLRRETGPPQRAYWRIVDYDGWRCVACGLEYLVGPSVEREDWEESYPVKGEEKFWQEHRPILRHHRGNCQLCGQFESAGTCGACRRRACASHFVKLYGRCVNCAPRCDCGRIAAHSCKRCKKYLCNKHRKRWFFSIFCAECQQVKKDSWSLPE